MESQVAGSARRGVPVTVVEVGEMPETVIVRELGVAGGGPQRPADMASELRAAGLLARYVQVAVTAEAAAAQGLVILAQPAESEVTALPADVRSRTVAVTEVARGQQRDWAARHGFLGLVTSQAWVHWGAGMMGARGVFGQRDIADAAGLVLGGETGMLGDPEGQLELPELLARYLRAAGPIVLGLGRSSGPG